MSEGELLSDPQASAAEAGRVDLNAATVRSIIRVRRLRDQYFANGIFADPAWDMLLDLLAARLEKRRVAVWSLCIAASVPPTTALRWIRTLTDHGIFIRTADPHDGRRVFVELSDRRRRSYAPISAPFNGFRRDLGMKKAPAL